MKYFISIFLIVVTFPSCKNENCDVPGGYDFQFIASLSPGQSTFSVGDTISIVSIFSDTIFDRTTGQNFILEDWSFFIGSNIVKIDTTPTVERVGDFFELQVGERFRVNLNEDSDGKQYILADYNYKNNQYSLAYNFIAKETGLYYFELGVLPNENQTFEGMCKTNKNLDGFVFLNNGADNNIDLLNESPDEHYNTWILEKPEQRFHRFGGYAFRVE